MAPFCFVFNICIHLLSQFSKIARQRKKKYLKSDLNKKGYNIFYFNSFLFIYFYFLSFFFRFKHFNMNALIALLHFCEVHGPCVVYCTQTIHQTSQTQASLDLNIPPIKSMPLETETGPLPPIRKNSLSNTPQKTSSGTCAACTAQLPLVNNGHMVTEAKNLYTLDQDDDSIKYIGTKAPLQNHLYKAVRLACVRRYIYI